MVYSPTFAIMPNAGKYTSPTDSMGHLVIVTLGCMQLVSQSPLAGKATFI